MIASVAVFMAALGTTSAFLKTTVPITSTALSAKAPAKGKAAPKTTVIAPTSDLGEKSIALPFEDRPAFLDPYASLPGYAGFDPFGFVPALKKIEGFEEGEPGSFKWYQEAELVHGRVAMLAVVGNLFPAYYHFPGNPDFGVPVDAYAELNPFKALSTVPSAAIGQIVLAAFVVECFRLVRIVYGDKKAGDLGLGQTGFNPFGFKYTEEEYFKKQVQEIKHGRLAMFGALGMLLQVSKSGVSVSEQLSAAFSVPEFRSFLEGSGTLNDYFPAGI